MNQHQPNPTASTDIGDLIAAIILILTFFSIVTRLIFHASHFTSHA